VSKSKIDVNKIVLSDLKSFTKEQWENLYVDAVIKLLKEGFSIFESKIYQLEKEIVEKELKLAEMLKESSNEKVQD